MKQLIFSTGIRWLWLTLIIFMIDVSSKQLIFNNFQLHELVPLIPHYNLDYVQNSGAAFSFLADNNKWQRWFLILVSIVVCVTLIVLMHYQRSTKKLRNISYALIIGGALGNLYDRLVHGFVVDFIDFYICDWHWPTFNIADVAIFVGSVIIIIECIINTEKKTL